MASEARNRLPHLLLLAWVDELCTQAMSAAAFAAKLHATARTCEDPREKGKIARKRQAKRRRQWLKQGLRTEHSLEKLRRHRAR